MASSRITIASPHSRASVSTSASPAPRPGENATEGEQGGDRMVTQSRWAGSGRSSPRDRPTANSVSTAGGISTCPTSEGMIINNPTWWRYCIGDVLQITSAKPRLLTEIVLRHPKSIDPKVGQLREEDSSGDACDLRRCA